MHADRRRSVDGVRSPTPLPCLGPSRAAVRGRVPRAQGRNMVNFRGPGSVPAVDSPLAPLSPLSVGVAQLCEDVPWGIAILDRNLNYLHVNDRFAAVHGRSAGVMIGR